VPDVETRRRGPSIWPWIIGLIVLALLVWALAELFGGSGAATDPAGAPVTPPGALLLAAAVPSVT
jgi:hypothetical protein